MALGAKSGDVLRMVLGEGMKMTVIGAAVGLALALPLPKIFSAMFVDLHIHEPAVYFIVPVAIFLVAILATYVPARRAAGVNPMSALRQD
jgi:ABC-type antimicrobial peptide transport system permease subunit